MRSSLTRDSNEVLLAAARPHCDPNRRLRRSNLNAIRTEAKLPIFVEYLKLPPQARRDSEEETEVVATLRALSLKDNVNISSYALLDRQGMI